MVVRRLVLVVAIIVALLHAAQADAQVTLPYDANAVSLGPIPDFDQGTSTCGVRDVTFSVPFAQTLATSSVVVSLTATHAEVGHLVVELIDPQGGSFVLFHRTGSGGGGYGADLGGVYNFSDAATGDWWSAAGLAGNGGAMPPGSYRTSAPRTGAVTEMNPFVARRLTAGDWTLRIQDCFPGFTGAVTAARLTLTGMPVATATATPSTLGAIPDGPTATPQTPGTPRDVTFTIPPGRGRVAAVRVELTTYHQRLGDVVARLIAPTGQSHVLFGYTGATDNGSGYTRAYLFSSYEFRDGPPAADWWTAAALSQSLGDWVPGGAYRTSAPGGVGTTGGATSMDAAFAGVPSVGTWTLRLTDGAAGQVGSISAASLTLDTDATPSTFAEGYSTGYGASLTIAAPGVLSNDKENLGGAISAQLVSGPANGTLSLAPSGAFTYTPALGFVGTDAFTYRATNNAGPGNVVTVSIAVTAPTSVQPPTAFRASSVIGNQVTLRWVPPVVGPVATDFVVEGGVTPGQVLGAVAVGGPLPIVSFPAPTGAFYLRVHAVDGAGVRSGPSNEIQVFVNTPAVPTAPAALTAMANGNSLALSWGHTFAGGTPTGAQLDVTGAATASLPLSMAETLTLDTVPAGTYTFRVRATNAAGVGAPSAPVTVTLPASCSGAPERPANVLAYALGRVVHMVWDPPSTGAAPASYVLHVDGAFSGSFSVPRSFRSPAPPGTYSLSLSAVNACGSSAQTAPQTVFVP